MVSIVSTSKILSGDPILLDYYVLESQDSECVKTKPSSQNPLFIPYDLYIYVPKNDLGKFISENETKSCNPCRYGIIKYVAPHTEKFKKILF
ncbi:MAG: hypothetical protein ACTJLM_05485 [Ehrlichia sp.]